MAFDTIIFSAVPEEQTFSTSRVWGVQRMATEFRQNGFSCQMVHFFNSFTYDELDKVIDDKIGENTLIVGFGTMWWSYASKEQQDIILSKTRHIIDHVVTKYPNIKIIAGGGSCRLFLKVPFRRVDAIFENFAENPIKKYLNSIKNNLPSPEPTEVVNGIPVYNELTEDCFDFTKSQTIYLPEDYVSYKDAPILEISRGCIFKCKFCPFPLIGKNKFDYIKDPDVLREELIRNYNDHGIQYYMLGDDTFNDSTYKVQLIHDVFTSLPFDIKFSCYLRLDLLNAHPEQIPMLKNMGLLGTFFGVESFNKKAASLVGKGMDPEKSKKLLHDLKTTHWGSDIKIAVGLIIGLPYETEENLEETKQWILDENNQVDQVIHQALHISNPDNPLPNPNVSEFQKNAKKYGFYWPDFDNNLAWHNDLGFVKSRAHAQEIVEDYNHAVRKTCRVTLGGFSLPRAWPKSQFLDVKPTMNDLIKMTRHEFADWFGNILDPKIQQRMVDDYKNNFLK